MEFDRETFTKDVMRIIQNSSYQITDLKLLLVSVNKDINGPGFRNKLDDVIKIFLEDRNGDNKINVKDLELLSKDPIAMLSLAYSMVLLLGSLSTVDFKNPAFFEEYICKLVIYIFLVIIPNETEIRWELESKKKIVNYTIDITHYIVTSHALTTAINAVKKLYNVVKTKCCCNKPTLTKDDIYDNHRDAYNATLRLNILKIKESK